MDAGGVGGEARNPPFRPLASSAATGHAVEWVAAFERSEKVDAVDRMWFGALRPTPG